MARVLEFNLPDLGEGLTGAEIVRWLVEVGDVVSVDQPVVEVETAKAMVEVPCPYGGVVTARFGAEGTELPVGSPLLTVAVGETAGSPPAGTADTADGTPARDATEATPDTPAIPARSAADPDAATGSPAEGVPSPVEEPRHVSPSAEPSGNVLVGYGTSHAPGRRRVPSAPSLSLSAPPDESTAVPANGRPGSDGATQPGGPADAEALPSGAVDGPVPVISPLVRRLARQHGLDLREMTGSGPDGLIMRADVEYALRAEAARRRTASGVDTPFAHATPASSSPGTVRASTPEATRIPLRGIRGAAADKFSRSRAEVPDATCWVDADATELVHTRAAMNAAGGPEISLLALLARICTAALARFPELNSSVDTAAREIVQYHAVHLGFATQTARGLIVPVVRDAHTRNAESLTAEFARLTEAARNGTLAPAELTCGTFTLNNYGVLGVDGSTPIINHPEAAMLGVGRIAPKPWVHEGELAVRQVVQLSLTFDHRVCDGGTAGGFLRYVADCVEQPTLLLRTL